MRGRKKLIEFATGQIYYGYYNEKFKCWSIEKGCMTLVIPEQDFSKRFDLIENVLPFPKQKEKKEKK